MLRPIHMLCSEVEIRAFERSEAVRLGCSLFDLMQRAAAAAFRCLRVSWPEARHITIVCGPGNNGGDGFALATLLRNAGLQPRVLAITAESRAEEAIRARALWRDSGGSIELCSEEIDLAHTDLMVDALFGIGLTRAPDGLAATVIQAIHRAGKPVLSIDLPSGVNTDSGSCPGVAVRANLTLAMIAGKRGLFTGDGKAHAGRVMCDDLGLAEPDCSAHLLGKADLEPWFKPRPTLAHKGTFGRALLIAGAPGMAGAALLAAGAARRAAPGYVQLFSTPDAVAASLVRHPEVMASSDAAFLQEWMSHADSIVMGPGVGQADAANVLLDQVVNACAATRQRLLLDADALNLLARSPRRLTDRVVLTPHPTEAARLLGITTPEVHSDRPGAAAAIAQRFGAICVLKGAGTVLAHPDGRLAICAAGNPGMAAAGMGDVLSGLGGGLMAQSDDAWSMACVATLLHAQAGDRIAARLGERAVTPSAVIDELGEMSS